MDLVLVLGALPETPERKALYEQIISICEPFTKKVSTPIDTIEFNKTANDSQRYERAMDLVKKASLIIGEHSQPSTGLGIEIRAAENFGVPVLIIAKNDSKVSGMAKGCPVVKQVLFYESNEELKEKIRSFLETFWVKKTIFSH